MYLVKDFYSGKVRDMDAFLKMKYNICYINGRIMINTKPLCYELLIYKPQKKSIPFGNADIVNYSGICPKRQSDSDI